MVSHDEQTVVPVWTLATEDVQVPDVGGGAQMTTARLAELRTVLATLAASPITTLEVHKLPDHLDRNRGIALNATSPLAQSLSQLVTHTVASGPENGGEALYRMVVPAKVAAQVGKGLLRPMSSKAAAGGVHSALVNSSGIAAQATFVPVAGAGALTVAAPLVFMAIAVGASAYADHQRHQTLERITEILEKLDSANLDRERNELDGCRDAIGKATAILLDQGRIGVGLGLDSSVYAINTAIEAARRRLARWQKSLSEFGIGPVELAPLRKAFPGIDRDGGEFDAYLELAQLAIALKKRVILLQAVEHAQLEDAGHPFENFIRTLRADEQRLEELQSGIAGVLRDLSRLELTRTHGIRDIVFSRGEVDELLRATYRLRRLEAAFDFGVAEGDVAIDIARDRDGSVVVLAGLGA